jgi:sugar/nucleoside kinase (ribokinase family)
VLEIMTLARQNHKLIFFDPGPQIQQLEPALMKKAISQCDYLFLTHDEACALVGGGTPEATAQNLLKLGPRLVALKMGSEGSLVVSAQASLRNQALPVYLRDSTGAGDAFDAAFVYGIMQGMPLEQTCRLANAAGCVTVSRIGAGTRLPLRAEIERFL